MYKPTPPFIAVVALTALVFGCLHACAANADDVVRFNHPTQYVDEDTTDTIPAAPLNAADIQATIVRVFDSLTDTTVNSSVLVERAATDDPNLPPPTQAVIPRPTVVSAATTQCYDAATIMKASAGGAQSTFSDKVCKTIQPPPPKKPKRPSNVTVT